MGISLTEVYYSVRRPAARLAQLHSVGLVIQRLQDGILHLAEFLDKFAMFTSLQRWVRYFLIVPILPFVPLITLCDTSVLVWDVRLYGLTPFKGHMSDSAKKHRRPVMSSSAGVMHHLALTYGGQSTRCVNDCFLENEWNIRMNTTNLVLRAPTAIQIWRTSKFKEGLTGA